MGGRSGQATKTSAPLQFRDWKRLLSIAKRIRRAVVRVATERSDGEVRPDEFLVLAMFWRIRRLNDAAIRLIEAGLPEESNILARSMFDESLFLEELASATEHRRRGLLACARRKSLQEARGLIYRARDVGYETDPDAALQLIVAKEKDLDGFKKRFSIEAEPKRLSVRAAAKRFGRLDDYWMREWSHQAVHGGDLSWMTYIGRQEDRIGILAKTNNPQMLASAAGFSIESFTKASQATFEMFGWPFPRVAASGWKEIEDAASVGRPKPKPRS